MCAISNAETIFPEAPILTLSLKFAPIKQFSTKTIASLSGQPRWSVNSAGAAPVPPSAPSIVTKSKWIFSVVIAFTIEINSQGCPIQSFIPTGLPPESFFSSSANFNNSTGLENSA